MTDKKKENRTVEQILADELDRQLEESPPKLPSREEFRAMAWEHLEEEKRKKQAKRNPRRILRKAGIAAGLVLAVLIGAYALNAVTDDVGADKNPKEKIITEDGMIIEDGGWGSFVEEGEQIVITDWDEVEVVKKKYKQLKTPTYTPYGYKFKQLTINNIVENNIISTYLFANKNKQKLEIELLVTENGTMSVGITEVNKKIECEKGTIYSQENNKKATIYLDDGIVVNIWHAIPEQELVKIIEAIQ